MNGTRRWLPLGLVNFQPSEFMKLVVVLYAADYTVRKAAFLHGATVAQTSRASCRCSR